MVGIDIESAVDDLAWAASPDQVKSFNRPPRYRSCKIFDGVAPPRCSRSTCMVTPCPRSPLVVPVLWCFVGGQAVFLLGVPPDSGRIAAWVMGIFLLWRSKLVKKQASGLL